MKGGEESTLFINSIIYSVELLGETQDDFGCRIYFLKLFLEEESDIIKEDLNTNQRFMTTAKVNNSEIRLKKGAAESRMEI